MVTSDSKAYVQHPTATVDVAPIHALKKLTRKYKIFSEKVQLSFHPIPKFYNF